MVLKLTKIFKYKMKLRTNCDLFKNKQSKRWLIEAFTV